MPGDTQLQTIFSTHKLTCFDVGAGGGFRGLEYLEPFTELVGFEPDETACSQLNNSIYPATRFYKATAWPLAVSDRTGTMPFYMAGNAAMNSLLKPTAEQFDVHFGEAAGSKFWREQLAEKKQVTANTTTLDDFCKMHSLQTIDLLKLDAQGAELSVFAGATALLEANAISIIKTEVSFFRHYENQCLFGDVDVLLRSKNYELIDCTFTPEQVNDTGEKAIHHQIPLAEKTRFFPVGDAVYIKSPEALTPEQATRAACVLLYWGYSGMARKLLARNPDTILVNQLLRSFVGKQQQLQKPSALKAFVPPVLWKMLRKLKG
jgi:FkbM family methyltransferase